MKKHTIFTLIVLYVAVFSASTRAGAVTLIFSEPDFEWHQTGGDASPYHIWVAGDFWAQNFMATDLTSASQISLSLRFNSDTPLGNDQLALDVFLNGVDIGKFSVPVGIIGSQMFTFSFAPVTGPDYRIEIRATNTIPHGGGAVSIALGGNSFATIVPEPSVTLLCSLGAVTLVVRFRRKRA